jgi:hypothetical protein
MRNHVVQRPGEPPIARTCASLRAGRLCQLEPMASLISDATPEIWFALYQAVCRKPHKTGGVCYIESLKRPPVPRKEIYEWDVGRQYSHTRGTTQATINNQQL